MVRFSPLVHLVLLAAGAGLLWRFTLIGDAPLTPVGRAPAKLPQDPVPVLSRPRVAALLGLREGPAPEPPPPEVVRADVPLTLLGTMAPGLAAVIDEVDGRVHTLAVGDSAHEVELREVGHGVIGVAFRGQHVVIERGRRAPTGTLPKRPPEAGSAAPITRAEVTHALQDLPTLMQQVQLLPAFVDGVFRGFRVMRLSNRLLTRAPDARRVEVELDRGGQTVRLSVSLE